MLDITFREEEGTFNFRACAVIIDKRRILTMHDGRSPYYYLPGGRVALHESAEDAVIRECREELDIEPRIARPLWLNQAFFTERVNGQRYHELCLYFLMDVSETGLLSRGDEFSLREGEHINEFKWLSFDQLKDEDFVPNFLKKKIFELPSEFSLNTERE